MSRPRAAYERQEHNRKILVNRLPPEVLSRIFVLGNALEGVRFGSNRLDRFKVHITKVCWYWRDVALNTNQLWAYIVIDGKKPPLHALVDISRASSTCLLDIDIDFITRAINYSHSLRDNAQSIRQLVVQITRSGATFDRWKSLRIVAKRICDVCAILESISGDMLALENLSIHLLLRPARIYDEGELSDSFSLKKLVELLARSPQLRTFQLTRFDHPNWNVYSRFSSIKNLTRLELTLCVMPSLSDFRSLLLNNPHLETLAIEVDDPVGHLYDDLFLPSDTDTISVSLAHLRTLALTEGTFTGWCQKALRLVDAPNLTSFRLDFDSWPSVTDCERTMRFLCSDNCTLISPNLRHLSLGLLRCSSDRFHELFTLCPNLVRLDWVVEQNRTYSLILCHPPWLLPKLSWMRISGVTSDVPLDYTLIQTASERKKAGLSLRVAEVHKNDWAKLADETKNYFRDTIEKFGCFDSAPEMQSRSTVESEEMEDEEESSKEESGGEEDGEVTGSDYSGAESYESEEPDDV